jgi:predicted transcriptional regulator
LSNSFYGYEVLADLTVFRLGAPRRSEVEIICDVLEICLDGAAKTSIVYRANLNFSRLNKYLSMLLGMGYVSMTVASGEGNLKEMKIVYSTTDQGRGFLSNFESMQQGLRKLSDGRRMARPLISQFR